MASVKFTKKVNAVPEPQKFKFLYGTYPPSPRMEQPSMPSIKPQDAATRDYAKKKNFGGMP